jgi:hypothetical protein
VGLSRKLRVVIAGAVLAAGVATPVIVTTVASAATGLTVVSARSPETGSEGFKLAQAFCPAGTHVVGGSARIDGGADGVNLYSMVPVAAAPDSTDSFLATAMANWRGYDGSWSVVAWAYCASGVTGWQIVHTNQISGPDQSITSVTASCPAGTVVIGAGGAAANGPEFLLNSVVTAQQPDRVSAIVALDANPGLSGLTTDVHAFAICVDPVPGLRLVSASSPLNTADKTVAVRCPTGTQIQGVSGGLIGTTGQDHITALATIRSWPFFVTSAYIAARQVPGGTIFPWSVYVFAICA